MILDKLYLQSDFSNIFTETFGSSVSEGFAGVAVWLIPLIALILVGIIGYIAVRILKIRFDYAGDGQRFGKFKIFVMGKYRIEGNLSKNEDFLNDDDLDELSKHKDIELVPEKIKQLIKDGKLFVYDFRITDTSEAFDLTGSYKSSKIISPNKLESEDFSWVDQKGERTLTSVFLKEYPRNVVAYHTSEHFEVLNPDRNLDDYWVLDPVSMKENIKFGFESDSKLGNVHEIKIDHLEGGKNLSTASSMIETLSESFRQIRISREQVENMQDLVEQKDKELSKKNIHINKLRHMMNQKVLIGFPDAPKQEQKELGWGWIIAGFFLGAVGIMIVPEVPALSGKVPDWFGAVIALVVLVAVKHLAEKKKDSDPYKDIEDE
jgi:hypothetical protein